MEYKLLAISKTAFGVLYYALVNESAGVDAIIKVKDGACYDIRFIETLPTRIEEILTFVRKAERKGTL